jgi:hypothetical protein
LEIESGHKPTRTRQCRLCNRDFTYAIGRGTDRAYCSKACADAVAQQQHLKRLEGYGPCTTEGCSGKISRPAYKLCESCYCRLRRKGSVGKRIPTYTHQSWRGYVSKWNPTHPLSGKGQMVGEHRMLLYDAIGDGPHPCFWCGIQLRWLDIVVDHLNEIKSDNRMENLVVACNSCNRARGAILPFIRRMRAEAMPEFIERVKQLNGTTPPPVPQFDRSPRPCKGCGNAFAPTRFGKPSSFCSAKCRARFNVEASRSACHSHHVEQARALSNAG